MQRDGYLSREVPTFANIKSPYVSIPIYTLPRLQTGSALTAVATSDADSVAHRTTHVGWTYSVIHDSVAIVDTVRYQLVVVVAQTPGVRNIWFVPYRSSATENPEGSVLSTVYT